MAPNGSIAVPVIPFHKDEIPTLNVGFQNGGDFAIIEGKLKVIIVVVPVDDMTIGFRKYRKELASAPEGPIAVMNPHTGDSDYRTFYGTALSEDDVAKLKASKAVLCTIGRMRWKDSTGSYATDLYQCFGYEGQGQYNWHLAPENDAEHKLQ